MLSAEQIKSIEYLVTGHSVSQTARELGISQGTIRNWLKSDPEYVKQLTEATDLFARECLKYRTRAYRVISKKIVDTIIKKVENGELENFEVDELIKMLDKTITAASNDENPKKNISSLTAIQNNIQINANLQKKLENKEFVEKFGEFLNNMSSNELEQIVDANLKAQEQQNRLLE
jgi:predicted transcriptional regulator